MPRTAGVPNRNYPSLSLAEALEIARGVQEHASGKPISRLLLADALGTTPNSSTYKTQLSASRQYGLTVGTEKADKIELTANGDIATGDDPASAQAALRRAAMQPEPFRLFFHEYQGKRVPSGPVLRKWLEEQADVPPAHLGHAVNTLLSNARDFGLIRTIKGSEYILVGDEPPEATTPDEPTSEATTDVPTADVAPADAALTSPTPAFVSQTPRKGKVFIGHGKNRKPVDQLKKMLEMLGVDVGIAVDVAHEGRPVSEKVADIMKSCTSACFVFTSDEEYSDSTGHRILRPSDNAVYELGAASVLYGRKIVIFKEAGVNFASDFSDLGYIGFETDQLDAKMGDLLRELVAFGIVEIRAAAATPS